MTGFLVVLGLTAGAIVLVMLGLGLGLLLRRRGLRGHCGGNHCDDCSCDDQPTGDR